MVLVSNQSSWLLMIHAGSHPWWLLRTMWVDGSLSLACVGSCCLGDLDDSSFPVERWGSERYLDFLLLHLRGDGLSCTIYHWWCKLTSQLWQDRDYNQTSREVIPHYSFLCMKRRAVVTGGFWGCRFRVQLSCIQRGRVQLFAQRVQRLSVHYWSIGMEAVHLLLARHRRRDLRWRRLSRGLWLGLGLLFLLGLDMGLSKSKYFQQPSNKERIKVQSRNETNIDILMLQWHADIYITKQKGV